MKTLNQVIENLKGIVYDDEFRNNVKCAFEGYEYEGKTAIVFQLLGIGNACQVHIDHEDAPIIIIIIEKDVVVDAWEFGV